MHEEKDKLMLLKGSNKLKDHDQFKGMYIKSKYGILTVLSSSLSNLFYTSIQRD